MGNSSTNETDDLVAQERNRKRLGRLDILVGLLPVVVIVLALISKLSSHTRSNFPLYPLIWIIPIVVLMLVCGFGVLSRRRPIWPLRLNRIVGFASIVYAVAGFITFMVSPSSHGILDRFIGPLIFLIFWVFVGYTILKLTSRIIQGSMMAGTHKAELGDTDTYEESGLWQILSGKFGRVGRVYEEEESRFKKADE